MTDGLILPRSLQRDGLTERQYAYTVTLLESRISQLEWQLEEAGWQRLDAENGREFSRAALDKITDLARIHYIKNPLVNRAVEVSCLYVWGQDVSVNAADEDVQAVIDRFWRENRATLTGQQASREREVELQVTGNVFLALFPNTVTGSVKVRPVPMEELREIASNPDDRYEPWFYKREWLEKPIAGGQPIKRTAYYPDWQHRPVAKPATIGSIEIRWETPMLHIRVGGFPHWRWGVSEVYAALDWAKAYKELLEDDATRSRALARFAWQVTTQGGKAGVAAAKAKLGTTLGADGAGTETNPPPTAGSAFIAGQGVNLDPVRIAGATLDPDHSRPARLMASAALGIPDHFFDADVGNFATSKTLDRPTELRFSERRQLWRDTLTDLCQWVIDRDIEASGGILPSSGVDEEAREVDLSWPSLLERETQDVVAAIVSAATLNGQPPAGTLPAELVSEQLMAALGVADIDGELAKLADEGEEPPVEAFMAALRELREALAR